MAVADQHRWPLPIPDRPVTTPGYGLAPWPGDTPPPPWESVIEKIAAAGNYWVSSTRPDGTPHVMPVWALWLDEALYFSSDPRSRKGRNLSANPGVVVHLESGDDVVIVEGNVEPVAGDRVPTGFGDAYQRKYGFWVDITNSAFGLYVVDPTVAFTWTESEFPTAAIRWRFP